MRPRVSYLLYVRSRLASGGNLSNADRLLRASSTATCVRYGDDCSYAEGGDSRTTYTKQHVAALEERVKMLEMLLTRPANEPCSRKEPAALLGGEISLGVGATEIRRPSGASRLRVRLFPYVFLHHSASEGG